MSTTEPVEYTIGDITLTPKSTDVRITGERGTFLYLGYSISEAGQVSLQFFGGEARHLSLRSFRPERVRPLVSKRRRRSSR